MGESWNSEVQVLGLYMTQGEPTLGSELLHGRGGGGMVRMLTIHPPVCSSVCLFKLLLKLTID